MKSKVIFLISGLIIGSMAILLLRLSNPGSTPKIVPGIASAKDSEQSELAAAKESANHLQAENSKLVEEIRQLKSLPKLSIESPPPNKASRSNASSAIAKFMKMNHANQIETQIAALKLRLHLTDAQEKTLRDILVAQQNITNSAMEKMMEGKPSSQEMEALTQSKQDSETQLKQLLTPEQTVEYEKYRTEQKQLQSEMIANMQLVQLQQTLNLNSTQQDQIFKILYQLNQETSKTEGTPALPNNFQEQQRAKKEALRSILTPEQFKIYEQQLDFQRQMMETLSKEANAQ